MQLAKNRNTYLSRGGNLRQACPSSWSHRWIRWRVPSMLRMECCPPPSVVLLEGLEVLLIVGSEVVDGLMPDPQLTQLVGE
jgi:hypothetical protein